MQKQLSNHNLDCQACLKTSSHQDFQCTPRSVSNQKRSSYLQPRMAETQVAKQTGLGLSPAQSQGGLTGQSWLPYLKWDDDHEDLLVFIRQDVLDECPASADESNGDEQQRPL